MFHAQQSSEKASQTTSCAAATTWQAKFRQGVFPKPGRPIRERVILLSRLFNESVETVHKLEKRAVQETFILFYELNYDFNKLVNKLQ